MAELAQVIFGKELEFAAPDTPYSPFIREVLNLREIPSAVGNYVNFLQVENLIVLPTCGLREDRVARETLAQAFPTKSIRTLLCRALAEEGGVVNCATWEMLDDRAMHAGSSDKQLQIFIK
jgi:agmatine/peptidylarginine deiminase